MEWDKERIKAILPQREPFLFIDEVIEVDGTQKVVTVKYVREDESFFEGHFPGNPVMPGVLITEAMAQSAIILYSVAKPEIAKSNPDYYLGKIKAEFLSPVYPGDKLVIETQAVKVIDDAGVAESLARVGDKTVAKASLVFGVKRK